MYVLLRVFIRESCKLSSRIQQLYHILLQFKLTTWLGLGNTISSMVREWDFHLMNRSSNWLSRNSWDNQSWDIFDIWINWIISLLSYLNLLNWVMSFSPQLKYQFWFWKRLYQLFISRQSWIQLNLQKFSC